jgi:ESX-1-secreted protein regulator
MTNDAGPSDSEYVSGLDSFAGRLNAIFETMHPRDRGPWENSEVAAAIKAKGTGVTCSPTYLWHLRNGTRDNPTLKHLHALAEFFHVPIVALVGTPEEAAAVHAQMDLVRFVREYPWLEELVTLLLSLNPDGQQAVVGLIRDLATIPGLAQPAPSTSRRKRKKSASSPASN